MLTIDAGQAVTLIRNRASHAPPADGPEWALMFNVGVLRILDAQFASDESSTFPVVFR
jgi:hypothetical protein